MKTIGYAIVGTGYFGAELGRIMKEQKYHIYLTEQERSEVIKSLIDLKNALIRQGKYTDAVDDLLVKLTGAKRKKLKVVYI